MCEWMAERFSESSSSHFNFVHNNISSFFCLRKSLFCDVRCTINCMHHMHVTIRMFFKLHRRHIIESLNDVTVGRTY